MFAQIQREYFSSPDSVHKARIAEDIQRSHRSVSRDIRTSKLIQGVIRNLYPRETSHFRRSEQWSHFYETKRRTDDPLLPLILNKTHCAENDLWELAIKGLVNYAKEIKRERGRLRATGAGEVASSGIKMGMVILALDGSVGRVGYFRSTMADASGRGVTERDACERCDVFELAFNLVIQSVNNCTITLDELVKLSDPSPGHVEDSRPSGAGGAKKEPVPEDSDSDEDDVDGVRLPPTRHRALCEDEELGLGRSLIE